MRLSLLLGTLALLTLLAAPPASAVYVLVSAGDQGQQGNNDALNCLLSGNGRYVFFDSAASNLVPGITNGKDNVFMRDLVTGAVSRVSVTADGSQVGVGGPGGSLFNLDGASADGRYVAMSSFYSLLDGAFGPMRCYLKDTRTGDVGTLIDANVWDECVSLSGDGRYALIISGNLVPGEVRTPGRLRPRRPDPGPGLGERGPGRAGRRRQRAPPWYGGMGLSEDGQYAVFLSTSSNLVANGNANCNVYLRDRTTETTELVSATSSGAPSIGAFWAWLSPDGRYVAFTSNDPAILPGNDQGVAAAYLWDRLTGKTERLDVSDAGEGGNADVQACYGVSAGGRYVVFVSEAYNLVPGFPSPPSPLPSYLYLRDRQAGTTRSLVLDVTGDPTYEADPVDTAAGGPLRLHER